MPISISIADYIPLRSLCNLLPGRPHIATAYRWSTRGIRGIRLTTYLVGGGRMTTLADFDRFIAEVTAARDSAGSSGPAADGLGNPPVDAAVPTTRSRLRDIARAELELDRRHVYVDPPKKKSRMKHGATDTDP